MSDQTICKDCGHDWETSYHSAKDCINNIKAQRDTARSDNERLQAERDSLNNLTINWQILENELRAEKSAAEQRVEQCREVISCVEWNGHKFINDGSWYSACPFCEFDAETRRHEKDCKLAAALSSTPPTGWVHVDKKVADAWFNCLNIPTGELASSEDYKTVSDFFRAAQPKEV